MINTEVLSDSLEKFARENKINEKEYTELKGRRNTIIKLIERYSEFEELSIVEKFNVGSYKIRTGVKRSGPNGWAFDIDYVLAYSEQFEYENFKNNLTSWLRKEVKEKYKRNVIVSNRKKVVTIAFRNDDDKKTEFYLDIAIYIKDSSNYYHVKRNENGDYLLEKGDPKGTYTRQKEKLTNNQSKRNAIIILKYLKEKNRIKGTSSIFITDKIISYNNSFDTFTLIKKFVEENKNTRSFQLQEEPFSELIKDADLLNESLKEMEIKFFSKSTTKEVFDAINSWMDYKLPALDEDLMEEGNERYSGG